MQIRLSSLAQNNRSTLDAIGCIDINEESGLEGTFVDAMDEGYEFRAPNKHTITFSKLQKGSPVPQAKTNERKINIIMRNPFKDLYNKADTFLDD